MNDTLDPGLLILLDISALILIPGVFVLALLLRKRNARAGKLISAFWLVGILGLIPGLANVIHLESDGCLDICLESATQIRGWPIGWLGFNGVGNLFIPAFVLGDIVTVAIPFALTVIILAFLFKRQGSYSRAMISVFLVLALVFTFLPLWVPSISNLYTTTRDRMAFAQQQKYLPTINLIKVMPGITMPLMDMNKSFVMEVDTDNTLKNGLVVPLYLRNLSDKTIVFPKGYGFKMFLLQSPGLPLVQNDIVEPDEEAILPTYASDPRGLFFDVVPNIPGLFIPAKIRIVLIGHYENSTTEVGAFLDITETP